MNPIRLDYAPLSKGIRAGRLNSKGNAFISKQDVTSDFFAALIAMAEDSGGTFIIASSDGFKRTVTVKKEKIETT